MAEKFIVETSARHIHVTEEQFKILFGADAVMHKKKDLSQPGQFAAEERLDFRESKPLLPSLEAAKKATFLTRAGVRVLQKSMMFLAGEPKDSMPMKMTFSFSGGYAGGMLSHLH